ncbi:MAG: hypothetical protein ACFB4I_19365 [Cyanophyceae cyanobacterium]
MAAEQDVKKYLAHWFQLGKKVSLQNGKETLSPQSVIQGDRYSAEFEQCWQRVLDADSKDCYLEGTDQTIQELLSDQWDINSCARCSMPIPMKTMGMPPLDCPCSDLNNWPNTELPAPRSPVDSSARLNTIRQRLNKAPQAREKGKG